MRKLLIGSFLILSFALGILMSMRWQNQQQTLSDNSVYFPNPKSLPAFEVLDHNNSNTDNSSLKNRWSLMFFGFTNCPDVCPNTLSVLSNLQNKLENKSNKPQLVFVSVDPMRDKPEIMRSYINSFSKDIIGFTGELANIQVLTDALGVAYSYNALPDSSYSVDHSTAIFIINPAGQYVAAYTGQLSTTEELKNLSHDFHIISHAKTP